MFLLEKISPISSLPHHRLYGVCSSGSYIHPIIKLAIALRVLAGGSYLDIAFGYEVAENHVMSIFYDVIAAIDIVVNNITFPLDEAGEEELRKKEQGFLRMD